MAHRNHIAEIVYYYYSDGFNFLLRDDFVTAESAPLTDPRQAEPGPGEWDVVDPDNVLSISGGDLVDAGTSTSTHGLVGDAIIRQAGLYMACRVLKNDANLYPFFGFNDSGIVEIGTSDIPSMAYVSNGWRIGYLSSQQFLFGAGDTSDAVVVIGADANYYFARLQGDAWQLIWVNMQSVTTPLYPTYRLSDSQTETDKISAGYLPAPFTRPDAFERFREAAEPVQSYAENRFSTGRYRYIGNVPEGTAGNADTGDAVHSFTVDTIPSSGSIEYVFRHADFNNYYYIEVTDTGQLNLVEVSASTPTTVDNTGTGAVSDSDSIEIITDDTDITVRLNGTDTLSYASATFTTATAFDVESFATGGAISDLVVADKVTNGESGNTSSGDATFQFDVNQLPASSVNELIFREQDISNRWIFRVSSTGVVRLIEINSGSGTVRATGSTNVITRITLIASGNTISAYADDGSTKTEIFTHTGDGALANNTAWRWGYFGNGGYISALTATGFVPDGTSATAPSSERRFKFRVDSLAATTTSVSFDFIISKQDENNYDYMRVYSDGGIDQRYLQNGSDNIVAGTSNFITAKDGFLEFVIDSGVLNTYYDNGTTRTDAGFNNALQFNSDVWEYQSSGGASISELTVEPIVAEGYTNDTADADFITQFTLDTLGTNVGIFFRQIDSNNTLRLLIQSDANIVLSKIDGGALTTLASAGGGFATDGQLITLIARGKTIQVFADDTLGFEYTDAEAFLRETGFEVFALAGGSVISDLRVYRAYLRDEQGLGNELVTNGGFDTDSDWTKGTGWTISGGTASLDGTQTSTSDLTQSGVLPAGDDYYQATFTISNFSAGTASFVHGSTVYDLPSSGAYTIYFERAGSDVSFRGDANAVFDVDNVSVKQVEFTDIPAANTLDKALS